MSAGRQQRDPDFRHQVSATVRFGDLDIRGHMNNVALIRMLETARVEYFMDIGVGAPTDYECVVASMTISFVSPANYRDGIICGVRVHRVGRTSIAMTQRVWRAADEQAIAEAEATLVFRSGEPKRPTSVPSRWRDKIAAWEPQAVPGTYDS